MEIKSYHFETFFQGLLFWLQYDFIHKRLRKKVLLLWKMHGMFTTMEKRDLILKAPLAIFNMQMHKRKKSLKLSFRDFQWHFVLGLQKIGTSLPKILFSGFFQKHYFLVTFLHRLRFNRYTSLSNVNEEAVERIY